MQFKRPTLLEGHLGLFCQLLWRILQSPWPSAAALLNAVSSRLVPTDCVDPQARKLWCSVSLGDGTEVGHTLVRRAR
jgi:hypothetical protein